MAANPNATHLSKEWNDFYTIMLGNTLPPAQERTQKVKRASKVARGWGQWLTYLKRDVLTKARNSQYLLVNALEAPALALLLAGFMRFTAPGAEYTFRASENIPPFLFISVIVALFLGLSVSAEEILRDRSLLNRERFLQVKWHHYAPSSPWSRRFTVPCPRLCGGVSSDLGHPSVCWNTPWCSLPCPCLAMCLAW